VPCLGCSAGRDIQTGLKRLRCSLAIPAQLTAWINFPFQKNAAISRNALWLSYLDPLIQLQQGSSLFLYSSANSKERVLLNWESVCTPFLLYL